MSVRRTVLPASVLALMIGMLLDPSVTHAAAQENKHPAAPVLRDHIAETGIRTPDLTYSGQGIDFDRDGDQDLFISNHTRGGSLWRNNGQGRFTQTATYAWPRLNWQGKLIDRHNCTWADFDQNGRLDAYCTTGRTLQNYVKYGRANELWLQDANGHFANHAADWYVRDLCGRGRVTKSVDANGDSFPDLVVSNAVPRQVDDPCNNDPALPDQDSKLFINVGGTRFRYAPNLLPLDPGMGERCIVPLDYNGDGRQDLFLCRDLNQKPLLFENTPGHQYVDVTAQHRLAGAITDAAVTDLDGDGDPDLVTSAFQAFRYQLNDNGVFDAPVEISAVPAGAVGWAVALGDINGDGIQDVYGMVGDSHLLANPNDVAFFRQGLQFTRVPVPHAGGLADDVVMVHPWRTGQLGILVLNGFDHCCGSNAHKPGPIQLLRLDG